VGVFFLGEGDRLGNTQASSPLYVSAAVRVGVNRDRGAVGLRRTDNEGSLRFPRPFPSLPDDYETVRTSADSVVA
jgi:hypothetical protein